MLLTAMGIAHIRVTFAMGFSSSSRYRMYSDILLAFVWFAVADEFILQRGVTFNTPLSRNPIFVTAILLTNLNAIGAGWQGRGFLSGRYNVWVAGVSAYEHPAYPGDTRGPLQEPDPPLPTRPKIFDYTRRVFTEAIAHGVYSPPQYPERVPLKQ